MLISLYLVTLTVLLTFLVLSLVEKIRTAFNKKKLPFDADHQTRRPVMAFGKR